MRASASMFVAESPAAPVSQAVPFVLPFRSEVNPQQARVDRLAQIEQERRIDVAVAKAVLAGRRFIDAARANLERGPNFAVYDVEDEAWAIVAAEPDPIVLAVARDEALDELRSAEEIEAVGMGGAPRANAIRTKYDLAASLGGVLAALHDKDARDADEIVSDLRARLSSEGATAEGARRALWCAVHRYKRAKAACRVEEGSAPNTRDERAGGASPQGEGG